MPGLGPELCHDRSHACLGFPRPWHRRCVTVALGVPSVVVSGLASGSGTRAPLWPILPSTDTRVVSVVLRVKVLRSTHNSSQYSTRVLAYTEWTHPRRVFNGTLEVFCSNSQGSTTTKAREVLDGEDDRFRAEVLLELLRPWEEEHAVSHSGARARGESFLNPNAGTRAAEETDRRRGTRRILAPLSACPGPPEEQLQVHRRVSQLKSLVTTK